MEKKTKEENEQRTKRVLQKRSRNQYAKQKKKSPKLAVLLL